MENNVKKKKKMETDLSEVANATVFRTQIAQIKGIISLALVICICEIPKICGL